jgi:hypothetical protein
VNRALHKSARETAPLRPQSIAFPEKSEFRQDSHPALPEHRRAFIRDLGSIQMTLAPRLVLAGLLIGGLLPLAPAQAQTFVRTIGSGPASGNGQLSNPEGVAVDTANGSNVVVTDSFNGRIEVFSATGTFIRIIGSTLLDIPGGIAIDPVNASNIVVLDGNVNAANNNLISVFTAGGNFLTSFAPPGAGAGQLSGDALALAIDPNNGSNIVVADSGNNRIVVLNAGGGFVRQFGGPGTGPGQFNLPAGVAVDTANGSNIVVADSDNNRIQVFSATGTFIRQFGTFGNGDGQFYGPFGVAVDAASGGNIIVADAGNNRTQVFSPTGTFIRTIGIPGNQNGQLNSPAGVAVDPANQGNVLVVDLNNDRIEVFTDDVAAGPSPLGAAVLPGGRSVEIGSTATVFATMLNTGAVPLSDCQINLPGADGLVLDYQTTDPTTNAVTGQPDAPVTIAGNNGSQSFVLSFQSANALTVQALPLVFNCAGVAPAPVITGVDTVDLTFSSTPIADIIALAAVATNNGIVEVPQGGAGAFAVATDNAGATDTLNVEADTGAATLPLSLSLCQTNPSTGQCLAPPAASVPVTITAGATPTFSVFVSASGPVPFAPGTSRIFVRFLDGSGTSHGATSVAVETQ